VLKAASDMEEQRLKPDELLRTSNRHMGRGGCRSPIPTKFSHAVSLASWRASCRVHCMIRGLGGNDAEIGRDTTALGDT
jgi:hypothetical protein